MAPVKDAWGEPGGRLYMTSLATLTLEVYYRYLPLYKLDTESPVAAGAGAGRPNFDEDEAKPAEAKPDAKTDAEVAAAKKAAAAKAAAAKKAAAKKAAAKEDDKPKEGAKPAAKTEAKPTTKTEAKPATKTEAKPAAKTEAKSGAKPGGKAPATTPEPKP